MIIHNLHVYLIEVLVVKCCTQWLFMTDHFAMQTMQILLPVGLQHTQLKQGEDCINVEEVHRAEIVIYYAQ